MGASVPTANYDRISFTSMNGLVGLYAALDQNNTFIKTLGAYVNICGMTTAVNSVLNSYGFNPLNPAVVSQGL